MTVLDDAAAHLAKAREVLEAAEITRDLELYNAAVSSAISSPAGSPVAKGLAGQPRR